jgi:D-alanyl-D-alanine carboxypeptidase
MSSAQSAGAMISTPNDIINWLNLLFSGKILSDKYLAEMMTIISEINGKPIGLKSFRLQKTNLDKPFVEIGSGFGIGLLYFKNYGFTWAHAGGTLGYESFYTYNPCNNIYTIVMYSVKPKQQFIFTKISHDLFDVLSESRLVKSYIKRYQRGHALPIYCQDMAFFKIKDKKIVYCEELTRLIKGNEGDKNIGSTQ